MKRYLRPILCRLAPAILAGLAAGCSTPMQSAREDFYQGRFERADRTLSDEKMREKDTVLHLMERGTVRQARHDYTNSTRDYLAASDQLERLETYSVSKGAASLVVNDAVMNFRGTPYERTLLHVFTAHNFLAEANWEDAAVASRRVVKSLMPEKRGGYPDIAYAHYVAGVCFELMDDPSNAALEYRLAAAAAKGLSIDEKGFLSPALLPAVSNALPGAATNTEAVASVTGVPAAADARRAVSRGGRMPPDPTGEKHQIARPPAPPRVVQTNAADRGQLICFVLLGRGPNGYGLHPDGQLNSEAFAEIFDGERYLGRSYPLTDVADLARATEEKQALLKGIKAVSRIAIKEGIALAVESATDSEELGELVRLLLYAMETPDVRRWETLPRWLQVARVRCPEKLDSFRISIRSPWGETLRQETIGGPLHRRRLYHVAFFRDLPPEKKEEKKDGEKAGDPPAP